MWPHALLRPCGALARRGEQGPESQAGAGRLEVSGAASPVGTHPVRPRPGGMCSWQEPLAGFSPGGQVTCCLAAPRGASSTPCLPAHSSAQDAEAASQGSLLAGACSHQEWLLRLRRKMGAAWCHEDGTSCVSRPAPCPPGQGAPLKCPCGGDASAATSNLAAQGMLKSTSELFLGQEKPG